MKLLAVLVFALAVIAGFFAQKAGDVSLTLLAVTTFLCAVTTYRARAISAFLKIFVAIFSVELVVFGGVYLTAALGLWPAGLEMQLPASLPLRPMVAGMIGEFEAMRLPESLPLTVAIFSILTYAVSYIPLMRKIMRIADRYFVAPDRSPTRVWPFPSFVATERRVATAMIVFLVLINQLQVAIHVRLNFFSRDWFNAIQAKDAPTFWFQLFAVFAPLAFAFVISRVVEYVVQSTLIIKWRRWLTEFYTGHWLDGHAHYRMALVGGGADNPDQRISEDINRFIDGGQTSDPGIYSFAITLISQLSSLVSFAIILWNISANFTLPYTTIALPGFLFWIALLYAGFGTIVTHLIGRRFVKLFFERQRREADFRFSLARLREYGEQVALLGGERAEKASLGRRFGAIVSNYFAIVAVGKVLTAFQSFYAQVSPFIPYVVAAPFYFAGKIELGIMQQTASAFSNVNSSLNFFVTYYTSLADFRSVLERLLSFDEAIERTRTLPADAAGPRHIEGHDGVGIDALTVHLPDGRTIVESDGLRLAAKESLLLTGPSGSGKSTFLRAISGIWPYGKGKIEIPSGARIMLLPQHPYIPIGTLRAAVTYPAMPDQFDDAEIREALRAAELSGLLDRLDVEDVWSQRLSGGEQQRLAVARALLAKPDWLFLDEATAAMDEDMEHTIYEILRTKLPDATLVSIGHRSTLLRLHSRHLVMTPTESGAYSPRELPKKAAE